MTYSERELEFTFAKKWGMLRGRRSLRSFPTAHATSEETHIACGGSIVGISVT